MHDVVSLEHLCKYTQREGEATPTDVVIAEIRSPIQVCGKRMLSASQEFLVSYNGEEDGPEWIEEHDCEDVEVLTKQFRNRSKINTAPGMSAGAGEREEAEKPLLIDGVPAAEIIPGLNGPRRSGRNRKKKMFFDEIAK